MSVFSIRVLAALCFFVMAQSCVPGCEKGNEKASEAPPTPRYTATIPPVAFILEALTAGRAEVFTLLRSGASPHTYDPKPSDVSRTQASLALFSVSPVLDGWAAELPSKRHIETIDLVPEMYRLGGVAHSHDGEDEEPAVDPHYWLDPLTVRASLRGWTDILSELDPAGAEVYRQNAQRFADKLSALHGSIRSSLAPVAGESVVLFHPGFEYLLKRYGIETAGVIEPAPGKEPTPKYLERLLAQIEQSGAKVVFTEPQLPARPAEIVREQAGLSVSTLDPLGSASEGADYESLIRYNAETILRSLQK